MGWQLQQGTRVRFRGDLRAASPRWRAAFWQQRHLPAAVGNGDTCHHSSSPAPCPSRPATAPSEALNLNRLDSGGPLGFMGPGPEQSPGPSPTSSPTAAGCPATGRLAVAQPCAPGRRRRLIPSCCARALRAVDSDGSARAVDSGRPPTGGQVCSYYGKNYVVLPVTEQGPTGQVTREELERVFFPGRNGQARPLAAGSSRPPGHSSPSESVSRSGRLKASAKQEVLRIT